EHAPGHGQLEPFRLDDDASRAPRLQELEAERPAGGRALLRLGALDPLDPLQLRLRLPRLRGLVAEALDEALEPGELLRPALGGARGVQPARGALAPPDVP